jgi:hypothetical protein
MCVEDVNIQCCEKFRSHTPVTASGNVVLLSGELKGKHANRHTYILLETATCFLKQLWSPGDSYMFLETAMVSLRKLHVP